MKGFEDAVRLHEVPGKARALQAEASGSSGLDGGWRWWRRRRMISPSATSIRIYAQPPFTVATIG
jgi:hypothetical protein